MIEYILTSYIVVFVIVLVSLFQGEHISTCIKTLLIAPIAFGFMVYQVIKYISLWAAR